MNGKITIGLLVVVAMFAQPVQARVLNVPDEYHTIQEAIDEAENNDTVLVAPGRYEETITFSGNNVVVAGTYLIENDEDLIAETIIDGSVGNGRSVVAIRDGEGDGAELAGFTITGGDTDYGGGVYCTGTAPYLHHLIIEGNHASHNGGGLYTTRDARVLCQNTIIRDNLGDFGGGGLTCYFSAITTIEDCIITANESNYGAGVQCSRSAELIMRGCTISENRAQDGEGAGGVWAWENASVSLTNCTIVGNTGDWCCGIRTWQTSLSLDHVLLTRNIGGYIINYNADEEAEVTLRLNNITVIDNDPVNYYTLSLIGAEMELSNSILRMNPGVELYADLRGSLEVSYCNIEDQEQYFHNGGPEWGEGNIDEDPLFVDRENGDYHLAEESPCIDSGDPEAVPDPDVTRRDMGALYFSQQNVWLGGLVLDGMSGESLAGASVEILRDNGFRVVERTNENGEWGHWTGIRDDSLIASITIRQRPYTPWHDSVRLGLNDSLYLFTEMGVGVLSMSDDTLLVGLIEGESTTIPIDIHNDGSAQVTWSASWKGLGSMSTTPGEIIESVNVGEITGDTRLRGVAYDGSNYYFAGPDDDEFSKVYVLDSEFQFIREFEQLQVGRYGMEDLEWDGELLWGIDDTVACGYSIDGVLMRSFPTPVDNMKSITFDPVDQLYWICGITTRFYGCDLQGNVQREIDRTGLRVYGLGWDSGSRDGYSMILLEYRQAEEWMPRFGKLYGFNPETLDTILLAEIAIPDGFISFTGLQIDAGRDNGSAQALVTMNILEENGGDRLEVVQLRSNREWFAISPTEGLVEAGQRFGIDINILTAGILTEWRLGQGDYDAQIDLVHDGRDGAWTLPVTLTVSPNSVTTENGATPPTDLEITQAFPQPFNSTINIAYNLGQAGVVKLALLTVSGQEVAVIEEGYRQPGEHAGTLNAEGIPSGVYLVKLTRGSSSASLKVVLVR